MQALAPTSQKSSFEEEKYALFCGDILKFVYDYEPFQNQPENANEILSQSLKHSMNFKCDKDIPPVKFAENSVNDAVLATIYGGHILKNITDGRNNYFLDIKQIKNKIYLKNSKPQQFEIEMNNEKIAESVSEELKLYKMGCSKHFFR